jgi:hypothetical protein
VATLETYHGFAAAGKQVNNLALPLIAPLAADDDNVLAH